MKIEIKPQHDRQLFELQVDTIAEYLTIKGFVMLADFLPAELAQLLLEEAQNLATNKFTIAGIGRKTDQQINTRIRTDKTLWLNGTSEGQRQYLEFMELLRIGLNRRLFMGLFDFESHFSHYKDGDFYKTHIDAFKGQSNRILSTVYYLNHDWLKTDGGELVLYAEKDNSVADIILPVFNQCVIFLSDVFPHEVKVSHKDRFSIAGWFRINACIQGQLDPSR
ncbi:2OG-Fe(II) oxygenase [Paraglaciecola sp. L3A3]|uniref:2OG-Fe(II) oxygenase n=1 Tax=Paraglaciecola sp. L3A3 TaxID=2686358 RepID=UPI00131BFFFF|nr:2OG-Fe(II) oxygenase [Paraglaciecola sp. L3A3]